MNVLVHQHPSFYSAHFMPELQVNNWRSLPVICSFPIAVMMLNLVGP